MQAIKRTVSARRKLAQLVAERSRYRRKGACNVPYTAAVIHKRKVSLTFNTGTSMLPPCATRLIIGRGAFGKRICRSFLTLQINQLDNPCHSGIINVP